MNRHAAERVARWAADREIPNGGVTVTHHHVGDRTVRREEQPAPLDALAEESGDEAPGSLGLGRSAMRAGGGPSGASGDRQASGHLMARRAIRVEGGRAQGGRHILE